MYTGWPALLVVLVLAGSASADLVGYWPLNGDATDASGHGNHGTIYGSVTPIADRHGNPSGAMAFAGGGSDRIDVGDPSELRLTGAMTLMAWVWLDSSSTRNGRIVAKMAGPGSRSWSLNIEHSWGDVSKPAILWVAQDGSNLVDVYDDVSLPQNQWVHVAGVYTPGTSMTLYVDGDLARTKTSGVPSSQYSNNGSPVLIGNRSDAGDCGWVGSLDEVRIYNEALSEPEIEAIMGEGGYLASNPDPQDGALNVDPASVLSWDAPSGVGSPLYDVYLGTDPDFSGEPPIAASQSGTSYDPDPDLQHATAYYWRIDVHDGPVTYAGSVWSFTTASAPPEPLKIMALGNSITQGHTTFDNYRHHLWNKLQAQGYTDVDFVGSHDVLAYDTDDPLVFDKDHEGHYGWHTDEILGGGGNPAGGTGTLDQWLSGLAASDEVPDVVLMHLGTNDVLFNPAGYDHGITIGEMEDVIDVLRTYNPDVTVLLAKIIPHNKPGFPSVDALNALIPQLDTYETASSEVVIVDHHTGFSTSWLADQVHPNATGAAEMSNRWFDALVPVLDPKPRVVVSTDIGGSDNDDYQSMVHYLVYADRFDTEGLISSPPYAGRKANILEVIDQYETDYANLVSHSATFPLPDMLRSLTKQGATDASPPAGYSTPTEGSNWIISCANSSDPRPLWILVWGSITDVAQAVHDDPSIKSKIRVYSIGSWNTDQDPSARNYLYNNHSDLWWIEADSTFRGMYNGGDQTGDLGNWTFVEQHVRYHGALGDFYYGKKPDIKMGDTPSVLYLLHGDADVPTTESWGGMFGATGHGPTFWTDLTDPQYREGSYDGAKTVNMWREDYLRDWQTRMDWAKDPASDADGDGVPNASDNCPYTYNPGQEDADGDGVGDVCDGCPADPNKAAPGCCGCGSPDLEITNLNRYATTTYSTGGLIYSDRSYTITSMPAYLEGASGIKTANDDKYETSEVWITFNVNLETEVYIAYDVRATSLPNWMSGYVDTGEVIGVSDWMQGTAVLYAKTVPAGSHVVLGGNLASGAVGADSNYFVLLVGTCEVTSRTLTLTKTNGVWGDVEIYPEPNDPNDIGFPQGTEVTLTAVPIEGKGFKHWQLFNPNYPDDVNYATIDANISTTIVMDTDMHVNAVFKCGSGASPLLPMVLVPLGLVVLARRWR